MDDALRRAIEGAAGGVPVARLRAAAAALSLHYHAALPRGVPARAGGPSAFRAQAIDEADGRLAYVVARLPATLAAVRAALARLQDALPRFRPASLLDLGAGPATGLWATEAAFPGSLERVTLLDRSPEMLTLGLSLWESAAEAAGVPAGRAATLLIDRVHAELRHPPMLAEHDLVLCSYALGELGEADALVVLERAWCAARAALVIVEPGWPRGHARLMAWRAQLLAWGAHVVAPCPHDRPCPLVGDDWCHFAARLARSRLHRLVKGGALGWEDEKFAYLVATRESAWRPAARIIAAPRIQKGHVGLRLCRDGCADDIVVVRREGAAYKAARKARWGDGWPPE